MKKRQKGQLNRSQITLILVCTVIGLFLLYIFFRFIYPELMKIFSIENDEKIAAYIESEGTWKGALILLALSILQVVSVFLPCCPVQIAAGLVYDWWKAFIICYVGFMIGNVIVYLFARSHKNNKLMSLQKIKDINNKLSEKDPVMAVAAVNLLPAFPNGACPYLAAFTGVSMKGLIKAVGCTCWIQILVNCIAGHLIIRGEFFWTVVCYVIEFTALYFVMREWRRRRSSH